MKPYVKPELFYESFEMNQSIAACGFDMNFRADDGCTGEWDEDLNNKTPATLKNLFLEQTQACIGKVQYYCYQNGADDLYKTFQS